MGPFTLFASILRTLWPFFKENMLQDGTMRDWLRRNRTTCIQILYQLIMLGVCLFLADMTLRTRELDRLTTVKLAQTQNLYNQLMEQQKINDGRLAQERASNSRMRVFLVRRCRLYPEPCQFLIEETVQRQEDTGAPATAEQIDEVNALWCGVVRAKDLSDDMIRQRYLRQCSSKSGPAQP